MTQVSFTIPGRLRGKGRHRSRIVRPKSGGEFVATYPDKKTVDSEAVVRSLAREAMAGRPPFQGPLILKVDLYVNTPQSWPKKRKASAAFVTGKPDIDNQIKLLGDACNGILWKDDAQLAGVYFTRRYDDSQGERVHVTVRDAEYVCLLYQTPLVAA